MSHALHVVFSASLAGSQVWLTLSEEDPGGVLFSLSDISQSPTVDEEITYGSAGNRSLGIATVIDGSSAASASMVAFVSQTHLNNYTKNSLCLVDHALFRASTRVSGAVSDRQISI